MSFYNLKNKIKYMLRKVSIKMKTKMSSKDNKLSNGSFFEPAFQFLVIVQVASCADF